MALNPTATPPVRIALPLEFQQDLFNELRAQDELVVLSRGLGLLCLVTNLLHSYDALGKNLIVIVGADDRENSWIGEALAEHAATSQSPLARGLTQINTDMTNAHVREKLYARGGIFSITSRILIVDLLSKLLDPETVTGLVLLHAEKVTATSVEAFVVRVFRQNNKTGFLKAFSDNPESLCRGFAPLSSTLKNLFLRTPSLYPRFQATVIKSLEGLKKAEIIELLVPMTDSMREIQNAILECVEVSISELRRSGTGLELEDWTIESALHRSFDLIIRRQLDPVWHRTSFKTRQIVGDLAVLRSMLHALLTYDAVSFNKYLDTILASHQPPPGSSRQNQSPWLFLDAANTIFETAKRRVFTGKSIGGMSEDGKLPDALRPVLEEQPKWLELAKILEEIEVNEYLSPGIRDDSNGTILIMCSDQATCRQIREYLQTKDIKQASKAESDGKSNQDNQPSAKFMMHRKLRDYLTWKQNFNKVSAALFSENEKALNGFDDQRSGSKSYRGKPPPNKRRRIRGGSAVAAANGRSANGAVAIGGESEAQVLELMRDVEPGEQDEENKDAIVTDDLENLEGYFQLLEMDDLVVVHQYDGDMDDQLLEEIQPRWIIAYEPDSAFIRRIEVYRSSHNNRNIKVYFMYYVGSVEEQRFLSATRREKDDFEKLIKERASMAMTINHSAEVVDPQERFLRTVNTRIAGGGRLTATAKPPLVVVDVREFRSSLPSLLHGRSMVVCPVMLTVGDYVLSPNICIERKSVSDLISSFKTGRLFNQVETMLQHYKNLMLLIEFDQNKSFTLDPFAESALPTTITSNSQDLQSKIVMLTIAFPRLKIIWSSSPYQTAEIFEELKKNQDEPDPLQASQVGLEQGEEEGERSFNQLPQDMLRAVPGMTGKNISRITLEIENLLSLSNLPEEMLHEMLGRQVGGQIHRFFNKSVIDE